MNHPHLPFAAKRAFPDALLAELQALLGERVSTKEALREHHGRDESPFDPMLPDAVAFAHSTDEVAQIVKLCAKYDTPIIPYGAGSSLEGHTNAPGGGQRQSPPVADVTRITVPGVSSLLGTIEGKHWFFVSDLAGILRGMMTQLSVLSVLAAVLIAASGFVLWRTRFGLRLRSCGEAPYAAESLGVQVMRYKYIAMTVSGGMAGLAGAFLVVGLKFQDGQTRGLGFIGLASMIFGNWRPGGLAAGAGLFGYTDALQLRGGGLGVAVGVAGQHDFDGAPAVCPHGVDLDLRGGDRHDDDGLAAQARGRICHAVSMPSSR